MLMGDLVLLDTEITPVMTKLLDSGLDVSAIHNHILRATPATFYMHVAGHGDPEKMASAIRAALSSASKTPFDPPATTATAPPPIDLDTAGIDKAMGAKGTANGGVYQYGIPRRDPAREGGMQVNTPLGGANAITVLPHTLALGLPDAFARRVARNTQLVLLEESNLEKVSDPAAGSGGIEDLTQQLCVAAWTVMIVGVAMLVEMQGYLRMSLDPSDRINDDGFALCQKASWLSLDLRG